MPAFVPPGGRRGHHTAKFSQAAPNIGSFGLFAPTKNSITAAEVRILNSGSARDVLIEGRYGRMTPRKGISPSSLWLMNPGGASTTAGIAFAGPIAVQV